MIFLKNFPPTWKLDEVYNYCKAFGEIDIELDDNRQPVKDETGNQVRKIYIEMSSRPPFETYAKVVYK